MSKYTQVWVPLLIISNTTACLIQPRSTSLKHLGSALTDPHSPPKPEPSRTGDDHQHNDNLFSWNASKVSGLQLNLGQNKSTTVELLAGNYSGPVKIHAETDEISDIDPAGFVRIEVNPSQVTLVPGGKHTVTVNVSTDTMAPDFDLHLHLVAAEDNSAPKESHLEIPLQVQPVYEVLIQGGAAPENWGLSGPVNFRKHTAGVTVRFINMDTESAHRVHSSGAIPHQDTTMAAAVGTTPGGTYEKTVMPGSPTTATLYCHSHEGSAQAHTLNFNVGSNLATFTQVQTRVLSPSCVSCHRAGNALGGIALETYTSAFSLVTAGNASASLLFSSVNRETGTMPPSSSTPLSNEQLLQLFDWIQAGAPNN
jgi:mono/diheme cytochrome c family protein